MKYLITGASSGIGKRCAERLLEEGHECILIVRNKKKVYDVAAFQKEKAYIVELDLAKLESIENMFSNEKRCSEIDGVVHCAGISPLKRVEENDIDTVLEAYTTNLFSFIELMRNFVKPGVGKDGASVVAMSSVVAHKGSNRQAVYSGTKAAIEATIRSMAKELLTRRIRLNAIVSSTVETEMLNTLRRQSLDLNEKIMKHSPLGIIAPDEICNIIEFLLSDKSIHITGASVPIDAGYFL